MVSRASLLFLLLMAAVSASCAEDAGDTFVFDDDDFASAAATAKCLDAKCDELADWDRLRLAAAGEEPPVFDMGWDDETLARWNHENQGTMLLPLSWLLALEEPTSKQPFLTARRLHGFGFLPARLGPWNPEGLPLGLAVHEEDGTRQVGFTCAACHTADITVNGVTARIPGGAGRLDISGFAERLADTFKENLKRPNKAYRFIARIMDYEGKGSSARVARDVFEDLKRRLTSYRDREGLYPTPAGPGRIDAFGAGRNRAFGELLDPDNYEVSVSNVSAPPLWDVPRFDWSQYNGSIRQALARNTVEAIGVGADLELVGEDAPLFSSTIDFDGLVWLEEAVARLDSPVWPDVWGAVDPDEVDRGRALYIETCAGCHGPLVDADTNRLAPMPSEFGEPGGIASNYYLAEDLGTDPHAAEAFPTMRVRLSEALYAFLGLPQGLLVPAVDGFQVATEGAMVKWFGDLGLTDEEREALRGGRPNLWRAIPAYRARPLNGMWSTAPFLHNGSVPDMVQLLGPASARDEVFKTGSGVMDPDTLGFDGGPFLYDTALFGNSNAGHSFEDTFDASRPWAAQDGVVGRALSRDEVDALIAFLKVLEPFER